VHTLAPGAELLRFYDPRWGGWAERRHHGPVSWARFDHHPPPPRTHPGRSVWYAGASLRGALAEAFGRAGVVDRASKVRLVRARIAAPVELVDLVGLAARRVGTNQEIAVATDYARTQAWARAFYDRWELQGIHWRGRQAGTICVVLTDRVAAASLALVWDKPIHDAALWPRLARAAYQCSLQIL
jgi:hypothetical protein